MTERTTIQIDTEQKEQLDEIKRIDGESYKSVVGLLIAHYNNEQDATTNQETEAIDTEKIKDAVDSMQVDEQLSELEEQIERLESTVKEATNAAQSADRKLENLQ